MSPAAAVAAAAAAALELTAEERAAREASMAVHIQSVARSFLVRRRRVRQAREMVATAVAYAQQNAASMLVRELDETVLTQQAQLAWACVSERPFERVIKVAA